MRKRRVYEVEISRSVRQETTMLIRAFNKKHLKTLVCMLEEHADENEMFEVCEDYASGLKVDSIRELGPSDEHKCYCRSCGYYLDQDIIHVDLTEGHDDDTEV